MPEDGILLSIVNKDLDKDVICVATENAFLGRPNGSNLDSKYSDNSLQLTNLSGYLVYQLTKHYLESALSSLKSSCPANLCIERSVISPLVEPAAHKIDENFFTTTDDVVVKTRGPDPAFQQTEASQCYSEAHLPSGNIKDGSQIITSSVNAESVTDLDGNAVSPREGTFKPAEPPASKIFSVIPSIYKVFWHQTALQYDSLAAQPVSLVANIGNDNPKPCSSDSEHILPEEGSRCVTDKAEDALENRQDGTVEKYFEDQAAGTETDMPGNEEGFVRRKCLSGHVHGKTFCDIALSSSENSEQDDVIPFNPGSNFSCTTAETSFYESNHMSDDEIIPISNSEGHALSISGETQQVRCGNSGLANKLLGDGLCVMGTRSVRFICASMIDTATETDAGPATEDPVIGTETDMSGNDSCVRNTCLSGDVHGESFCNVSLNRSEKPEQEDVIHFNQGSNCTAVEVFESDHMRDNEKTSTLNSEGHAGEKPYTCKTCGKSFVLPYQLKRHVSTHVDGKPFACDVCSKRFRLPDQLKKHKVMHTAGKPFMCDRCGKTFKRGSDLKYHEDNMHAYTLTPPNAQPSLECGVCGKCLSNRKALKVHIRGHRGETPFACSICNKAFTRRSSLKTHMWTHYRESSKSYSCEICKKSFREAYLLRDHGRFHTGEKPFTCETCGKSFVLPYQLKRHVSAHVDGKPFACDVCSKRFRLPYQLKLHKATHTGEKPFMCDRCGKVFKNVSCLKYHARSKRACTPSAATEKNVNQCKDTVCEETSQSSLSSQDVVSNTSKTLEF